MIPSVPPPPDYSDIASKRMGQFLNLMDRFESLSWETIKNIITVGVWDKKEQTRLFFLMKAKMAEKKEPKDVEGLETSLRAAVPSSFHIAERIGGLSGIGSMVFDTESGYDDYKFSNPDILIMNFDEGSFGRISGPPRKGKTNTGCKLIERWIAKDNLCFTNIYLKKKIEGISYVNDARGLLTQIANTDKGFIFVYDEGQASGYSTQTATSLESRYTDNLFRVIGKMMGNVLYIDQIEWKAPNVIKEWSMTKVRITDEKGIILVELGEPNKYTGFIKNFPKTTLPFVTRDIASFDMNVNVERMFQLMSGKPDEARDIMLKFLDTPESIPAKRVKSTKSDKFKLGTSF